MGAGPKLQIPESIEERERFKTEARLRGMTQTELYEAYRDAYHAGKRNDDPAETTDIAETVENEVASRAYASERAAREEMAKMKEELDAERIARRAAESDNRHLSDFLTIVKEDREDARRQRDLMREERDSALAELSKALANTERMDM